MLPNCGTSFDDRPNWADWVPLLLSALSASSVAQFVYVVDQGKHMIDRGLGQYAVAQIEDMSGAASCLFENSAYALADVRQVGEEHGRIEIPLHAHAPARA